MEVSCLLLIVHCPQPWVLILGVPVPFPVLFFYNCSPPMQEEILSIVYCEPRSGCLKLLRFILKYGVPVCCGLIIEFKGAESAVSATVLSAWTAYVVICRNLIAHGILDATQWFAAVVFLHVDYLIFCGHLLLRSIRFLSGAACILHFSRCNCCVLWSDAAVSSSR
ncbi:uncharacterized protein LOC116213295 isoform X2 [Punica granatum]|uniref:Uncharacterized protein LOC116213295 isoform X2 n=1 Tax=Punica granatum TaxID=22663 RepID=A0A6P8EBX3_PUNGR|nr:uncharacterized protein LOC116213295 isoform X2 [Punica granatum]